MDLTASMEDYLEAILRLARTKRVVRVRDVARAVGVSAPSATGAIKLLQKRGLVTHERYEDVVLTRQGKQIARDVNRRHEDLRSFFEDVLLLPGEAAEEEACRLEHAISATTLDRLRDFIGCLRACRWATNGCVSTYARLVAAGEEAVAASPEPALTGQSPEPPSLSR